MKKFLRKSFIFIIAALVVVSGFGLSAEPASAATGPTSITVKADSWSSAYSAYVVDYSGKTKVYISSVYPSTRSKNVTWSLYSGASYGKIVSKTSTYCYVQGIKYGSVVIKARSNYYPYATKYITIKVRNLVPTGITLSRTTLNMWKGSQSTLTATLKPLSVKNNGITWSTSNSGLATVGTTGTVSGKAGGTAKITATSKEKTTVKATCTTNVFDAALTTAGRIEMEPGDADISNPVIFYGPAVAKTITYASSNNNAVTVNSSTGVIHAVAEGSATITATVTIPSISVGSTTKKLTYVVNVKKPLGNDFTFDQTWAYLEITQNTTGYLAGTKLMLNKSQLDDLFGYGSLGMNIWDPMDMYFNFQAKDIKWHAGDFAFDKVNQTDTTKADVEILPDKDASLPTYHPYWLDDTAGDKNCVDLFTDIDGVVSGYEILFYNNANLGADKSYTPNSITLNDNALTLVFETSEMKLVRNKLNQVQAYATVDADGTLNDLVLTITRTLTGYKVVVDNPDYIAKWGIEFNGYPTYL